MKEKLFVISVDALVHEDIAYLSQKPNFSKIMAKRAEVEQVCSVYPSVTYPAHASILTGCRPGKHGIYNNTSLKFVRDGVDHWHLFSKSVRVEDLFAAAKRAGRTTASVYWPTSGRNPNIDHVIDEYFFFYPDEGIEEAFARLGADEAALAAVRENLDRFPTENAECEPKPCATYDHFLMGCACSLIRNQQPDVMLVHNCYVDTYRHHNGVFNSMVDKALDQVDEWLGEVVQAMEDAGVYEDTNFVILSDHGQMDFTRRIKPNVLFVRQGWIDVAPDGTVYDWQVFAQANGMSVSVYLRDSGNKALWQQVYDYLQKAAAEGKWGFSKVYTTEEVRERYGLYGPFSFVLETDGSTTFSDKWLEPLDDELNLRDYRLGMATHGYEPEKGPQPVFMGHGPAFKEGALLSNAQLIDIAPTLAAVLGQEMPQAEGRCLQELLR